MGLSASVASGNPAPVVAQPIDIVRAEGQRVCRDFTLQHLIAGVGKLEATASDLWARASRTESEGRSDTPNPFEQLGLELARYNWDPESLKSEVKLVESAAARRARFWIAL